MTETEEVTRIHNIRAPSSTVQPNLSKNLSVVVRGKSGKKRSNISKDGSDRRTIRSKKSLKSNKSSKTKRLIPL